MNLSDVCTKLSINQMNQPVCTGQNWLGEKTKQLSSVSPVDGSVIASTGLASSVNYEEVLQKAQKASLYWRAQPYI